MMNNFLSVISIGTDENILKGEGRVFDRVFEYRSLVKKYFCLVFTKNKNFRKIEKENFVVLPIYGQNKFLQVLKLFKEVRNILKKNKNKDNRDPSVFMSQDPFEIGFLTYLLSKKFKINFISQLHTDISSKFFRYESVRNYFQYLVSLFVLQKSFKVRVVSKNLELFLNLDLNIDRSKIFYMPIYTDIQKFNFNLKTNLNKRKILMLSRIEEVKNIPLGIKAVKALRKLSNVDYRLKIVGDGNLKNSLLKKYNYEWIEWKNWTENIEEEYHEADIFLITSNYEGWGLTAIESVACGTPVAMSPVGVATEFIQNGINGYVGRGHDVINITESLYLGLTHKFDRVLMQASLRNLQKKEEYFAKFKKLIDVV